MTLPDPDAPEALRVLGPRATLSHEEAARRHNVDVVADSGVRRATVPRNRSKAAAAGWVVHRADLPDADRVLLAGVWVTTLVRTVLDLARVLPLGPAVAFADSALRSGKVKEADLRARLLSARGRGAGALRRVAALMDAKAESVMESLCRVVIAQAGLPAPVSQYKVSDAAGRVIARVDFAWVEHRLVLECDGFAFHSDRDAYRRDRDRMNELERHGWRVLRVTWEDVVNRPVYVEALVRSCLYGTHAA